jgi:holo-[acyl-carrier protein] synthase
MIRGIGIDTVTVTRFNSWHSKNNHERARIFSQKEQEYCCSNNAQSAQRFAARFAAKEALFKALQAAYPSHSLPLLTLFKHAEIVRADTGRPEFVINWNTLNLEPLRCHVSLTHTATDATAIVLVEDI